ncbi:hypothetical protein LZC95_34030 [Pendulispora brunnea]|uniref:Secreted protein n=1 Tax=Pendulispora brunnea TaxID=2905690 RepID=A0ABZ2K3U6_9BACT
MVSLKKASIAMVLGLGLMGCGSAATAPSAAPAADPSVLMGPEASARRNCREDHSSAGAAIFTPNDPESTPAAVSSQQALAYCNPKRSVR